MKARWNSKSCAGTAQQQGSAINGRARWIHRYKFADILVLPVSLAGRCWDFGVLFASPSGHSEGEIRCDRKGQRQSNDPRPVPPRQHACWIDCYPAAAVAVRSYRCFPQDSQMRWLPCRTLAGVAQNSKCPPGRAGIRRQDSWCSCARDHRRSRPISLRPSVPGCRRPG